MDARKGNIYEILNGNKQFLIPVYQRFYSWDIDQCKRLWNDIVEMQRKGKSGHFVGSIVNIAEQAMPELIYERADAGKPHMGLTTWAVALEGEIVKSDVSVAKNYLSEQEMRSLERIVSAYLDLAEDRAARHIPMTMEDWAKRLDLFLMADDR